MIISQNAIPLTSGAYQARSYIADKEICENLFPELNPAETDPVAPVTHYPREGLKPLSAPPVQGPGRGIFTLSNGNLFAAVGASLYFVDRNWVWTKLGPIANTLTPISMSDNGVTGVAVDGSVNGYEVTLADNTFAQIVDPTGTFVGSRKTDFSDTFLAFSPPGTNQWNVTLSDQVVFNALVEANADSTPDPIQTFAYNIRQMWLLKSRNSEIWFLAGSTPFPYQSWPNVFVPYGCSAPYSLVRADVDLFWIASNKEGEAIAVKTNQYAVQAVSTRALEYEWSKYLTVADVIGGTFQQAGHTFVVFHFPTADRTWCYDLSTKQWHRRTWTDINGVAHREKVSFYASVDQTGGYPKTIVGQDWSTGQLYALDPQVYTDNGNAIIHRRSFPHILKDMHEITHTCFIADFETGDIPNVGEVLEAGSPWSKSFSNSFGPLVQGPWQQPAGPALCMRYSNNGGGSFGNYRPKTLVGSGKYRSMMRWRGLGMARDRVYELMYSYPGSSALQGAYVEPIEHAA